MESREQISCHLIDHPIPPSQSVRHTPTQTHAHTPSATQKHFLLTQKLLLILLLQSHCTPYFSLSLCHESSCGLICHRYYSSCFSVSVIFTDTDALTHRWSMIIASPVGDVASGKWHSVQQQRLYILVLIHAEINLLPLL